jgi:IrrE N-terminal-like domain
MPTYVCGKRGFDLWVEVACSYASKDIPREFGDNLVFLSTVEMDACRVGEEYRQKEIILLSERLLPKSPLTSEGDYQVRYLIFAVLHEIAHVYLQHQPPNTITPEVNQAQEDEADALALNWFNQHVEERGNPYLQGITMKEVEGMRHRYQALIVERLEELREI